MQLMSPDFQHAGAIPSRYTCDGENMSPAFSWKEVPQEAKSFALVMHDPDAPREGGFTHWVIYNIPGEKGGLNPGVPKDDSVPGSGMQGRNDAGQIGYIGPCPPSGAHRYFIELFALDYELGLQPGATLAELKSAMEGHVLDYAELMGTYRRRSEKAA